MKCLGRATSGKWLSTWKISRWAAPTAGLLRWVTRGLLAYSFLLPIRRLYLLPGLGSRLQLTEICFLLFAPLAIYCYGRRLWPGNGYQLIAGLLCYLAVLATATLLGPPPPDYPELLGRFYLLGVLLIFTRFIADTGHPGQQKLLSAWSMGLYVMGVVAYVGYALALTGHPTSFVSYYEHYPYFGTLYRAVGTAGGATALVALSILPCTLAYVRWREEGVGPWLLLFLSPLFVLTFSKEVMLLLLACALVEPVLRVRKGLRAGVILTLALVYTVATHVLIEPVRLPLDAGREYTSGRVIWRGDNWRAVETSYTSLKRAAVSVATDHPWIGVGADGFPDRLPAKKRQGVYPAHLPDYTPHSTWFGTLAETGLLGVGALICFVFGLARVVIANGNRGGATVYDRCLTAFFSALLVGSVSMDLLHLRFFWVPVAMSLGAYLHYQSSPGAN